jgi:hypothetical protein
MIQREKLPSGREEPSFGPNGGRTEPPGGDGVTQLCVCEREREEKREREKRKKGLHGGLNP